MNFLQKHPILITGASSGTGLGLCEKFINEGFQVIGNVRSQENAEKLKSRFPNNFIPLIFDITKPDQVKAASLSLTSEFGIKHLSTIINNAGSAKIGPLLHVSPDELTEHLNILVVGQLTVIQNFYNFLTPEQPHAEAGRIINITSVSGVNANYLFGCYTAAKHALEGMSKTLRRECKIYGIKVTVVAPGNIATALWDKQTIELAEKYRHTDYFEELTSSLRNITSSTVKTAMSVEEFSDAFYRVFAETEPANRYTIVKVKQSKIPFKSATVQIRQS